MPDVIVVIRGRLRARRSVFIEDRTAGTLVGCILDLQCDGPARHADGSNSNPGAALWLRPQVITQEGARARAGGMGAIERGRKKLIRRSIEWRRIRRSATTEKERGLLLLRSRSSFVLIWRLLPEPGGGRSWQQHQQSGRFGDRTRVKGRCQK